ncbi:peptidoglycan/LPS O-acetylase OafA/YrhL [Paraburkholderia sp. 40]
MFRREASWNFVSWSISAEWFAVLFLFSLCARVLSRLSRVTFGVIVLVCWLTLCVYCFLYNDGDVGLTTFGVLRIVLQAWRGTSRMTCPTKWRSQCAMRNYPPRLVNRRIGITGKRRRSG